MKLHKLLCYLINITNTKSKKAINRQTRLSINQFYGIRLPGLEFHTSFLETYYFAKNYLNNENRGLQLPNLFVSGNQLSR